MVSVSHNFVSFTNLFNRFLISVSLLTFAIAADLGFSDFHLKMALLWFTLLAFCLHGFMLLLKENTTKVLALLLGIYSNQRNLENTIDYGMVKGKMLLMPSFVMLLFLSSFSIPMLFVSVFPEFRASILQTSSLINAGGSILNIYFVEKRIAELMDSGDTDSVTRYSINVIFSRTIACFVLLLSFSLIFLVSNN